MTGDAVVRTELRPGDIGALVALHGRVYSALCGWTPVFEAYVAETFAEAMKGFDARRERLWIVEQGGAILGSIGIIARSAELCQLRWFLLDPSLKGRGLGRRMLHDALRFTRERGYKHVILSTTAGLPESAHLYESVGFRRIEEKPPHTLWGPPVVEEIWELPIG